jgi:tetratricopeptide (TPR) repeat protein
VARQLNVAHVLEGSVRKMGNQVRITAQLIDARSDTHLWSETYDRELENIFAVQDEISAAIIGALKARLGLAVEAVPGVIATSNSDAHEAYLRGRFLVAQGTQESVKAAIREFENAITLDPDYALAHAELSMAAMLGYTGMPEQEANALGARHAERAMALDPTLAESQAAAGWIAWVSPGGPQAGHLEQALSHYENAVQINPNYSDAYNWMANILEFRLGRYKESFEMREMALRLDPLSIPAMTNHIRILLERNRFADAERELKKLDSVHPGRFAWIRNTLILPDAEAAQRALAILDEMQSNPQWNRGPGMLEEWIALMGLDEEVFALSEQRDPRTMRILGKSADFVPEALAMLDDNPGPRNSLVVGHVLASAGDYAGARALLEDTWQLVGRRVVPIFPADAAAALAVIRGSAGDSVDELLAAIRENVHQKREAGMYEVCRPRWCAIYDEGLAAFLSADYEQGLTLIREAVENGYFVLPNEAYLQALYDDSGFAPVLAAQRERQKRERDKFLAIVCSDNPYEAVWQPEGETCVRFLAESGN